MADETDAKVLNSVQDRFEVNITELPDEIDVTSYSKCIVLIIFIIYARIPNKAHHATWCWMGTFFSR